MNLRKTIGCLCVVALSQLASGCIVVIGGASPKCWSDEVSSTVEFDTDQLSAIHVKTHNGSLRFEGEPNATKAYVDVKMKGGGASHHAAADALDAIEIVVDRDKDGVEKIGWRWREMKHWDWRAVVSFDVHSPAEVDLNGLTHNGSIVVAGAAGDVQIITHNGRINVDAQMGTLHATTHNGKITADYAGENINLSTHNGSINADLKQCNQVQGAISTHNGGVQIVVSEQTSTKLACSTHNGSIRYQAPLKNVVSSKHSLVGTIGDAKGVMNVATHNGSVRIKVSDNES